MGSRRRIALSADMIGGFRAIAAEAFALAVIVVLTLIVAAVVNLVF